MSRTDRFLDYFKKWKGDTVFSSQRPYFNTALLIEAYVSQPDSTFMINGINNDDSVLDSFRKYSYYNPIGINKAPEKGLFAAAYGTLLYAILAIEDYLSLNELLSDDERILLDRMSTSLKTLYNDYRNQPTEQLNQLLSAANQWLTMEHQNHEQSEQLMISLFATLSICYQAIVKIKALPWAMSSLITRLITIETFKAQLEEVLETAKTTVYLKPKSIPTIIIPNDDGSIENSALNDVPVMDEPSDSETDEDVFEDCREPLDEDETLHEQPAPLLTIDAYYDKQSLDILKQSGPTLSEKIRLIKTTRDNASQPIKTLIAQKNKQGLLENELNRIQADLIHQDETQEAARRIPITLYKTGFFFSTFVSSFVKMNTPEIIRDHIDSLIPENPLPLEKQRMLALVGTSNDVGQPITMGEIQELEIQINHTVQELAGENSELKQLFIKATSPELSELSDRMHAASELMNIMADLIDTVKNNQITLKDAKMIDGKLDAFILQHDGILVTISLLLSHYIHSFFKTDTAAKIESARFMKEELIDIKEDYLTNINDSNMRIQSFPILSTLIKETVITDLTAHQVQLDTEEETTTDASNTILSQFNTIHALFQPLKTQHGAMLATSIANRSPEP